MNLQIKVEYKPTNADPSDREVYGVGMRPLPCWDCGFESRRGHGYLSFVSVVRCQVEVSATSWSLLQMSPTDCGASLCVICKPHEWAGHSRRWAATQKKTDRHNCAVCSKYIFTLNIIKFLFVVIYFTTITGLAHTFFGANVLRCKHRASSYNMYIN